MGISIHYKGKLKSADLLPTLIEEVKDIAEIHHWKHHIFEKSLPENHFGKKTFNKEIYGICFSPPDCEPVQLTFLSNGVMCSPWALQFYNKKEDKSLFKTLFTKTHYAGPAVHKLILHLFEYFQDKYLKNFELFDEAQYWETKDEELMHKNFNTLNAFINAFADSLESNTMLPNESIEKYLLRIAKDVHSHKQNEE